jgi:hypothetical protein
VTSKPTFELMGEVRVQAGTGFSFVKVALSEMPVATMVLFCFVFACAGLAAFHLL